MSSAETLVVTTPQEEEEVLFAMEQAMIASVPLVLKAAMELGILELLSESSAQLSPAQIASRLSIKSPDATVTLDRILRFLASYSFLSCTLAQDKAGRPERLYGLGPKSKFLVNGQGHNIAPWVLFLLDKVSLSGWFHLKEAVVKGEGDPFKLANGAILYEYTGTDPELNNSFNNAMKCGSTYYMGKIMEFYRGFEGARTVVDVGGGVGESLRLILSKHPHLRGINFDLPYVVKDGVSYPGLEHVAGSFVDDPIPKGDVLLVKWQFHGFGDEFSLQLLKNCWSALPASGKVVIIDPISPEYPGTDLVTRTTFTSDMIMLGMTNGGKDRTLKELEIMARAAGFGALKVACRIHNMWVLELYKTA
ncbi:caffeic acid 3-O-methyltransferase-like [Rhodamnia argentea]|uniref:Caffeic acid 3-O-methyltransferase-like n=1 Tax=Rhodamnia argentea TaxID=178133 RepID=A0A8B8PQU3_9MYRT|nr:caffeic acid 3-O-methyltransferase-like [Rhodamnia argentea]